MGSGPSTEGIEEQWEKLEKDLEKENNDFTKLTERTVQKLNLLMNAKLDIAITGLTGAGKSSLVNALRGMTDDEEGAAEVGVIQTTLERKQYPHPKFPNVTLWDLPGVGTCEVKAQEYLQKVHFTEYDFFIIVASVQFTTNDVMLAKEIHKMNKKFYYVRTKVDTDIESERRRQNFSEEKTLEKIRKYCCDNLAEAGEFHPRVFLVSSHYWSRYDFQSLLEFMGNELDELKRYALKTAFSNSSKEILKQKKAAMKALIGKVARRSSTMGARPVPGLSLVCNIPFLKEKMRDFSTVFGLDEDSLHRLAKKVGKPFPTLSSAIKKTRIASKIDNEFVQTLLSRMFRYERRRRWKTFLFHYYSRLFSRFGRAKSSAAISHMLQRFLDDAEEDAENVLAKAVGN
ncbi:PREDICTED: interferon-inducible GTPase 5-like [Gekko japonicus]|uniref:Interferon-inducible GTPase 5-like n=1 Tax=Gekko japonicus TaxID=146911 RepID=A0ABM1LD89_GEKJA|nr:PREDICTED: interferon-inducible GTPase 5-like [Gekko japonicus]